MPPPPIDRKKKIPYLGLLLVVFVCALVYEAGLDGPFLFDDHAHIRQNVQVQIDDLSLRSLSQAWNSSFSAPPSDRPMAQLTFGINHAFGGLSTYAFKATNLAIHLMNGWLIFLLARALLNAQLFGNTASEIQQRATWFALTAAAIWLLHPLNLTPVLYIVQRMTQLSTLFVLLGLWLYVSGRLAIAREQPGILRVILAFPIALFGVLAKENAALFPVLILVLEFTILRNVFKGRHVKSLRAILIAGAIVPTLAGLVYLIAHPELYTYTGRQFGMEERLLTQARALWFYLQMFISPDLQQLALFHDDFPISQDWLTPISTLPSVAAWVATLTISIVFAQRIPVISFGALFFLAAHSLESSIIPLEMVFEHRNYLALLGPAFVLAYLLTVHFANSRVDRILLVLGGLLLLNYAFLTHLRAVDWASASSLTLSEVDHHPESKRANFKAAQLFISLLDDPKLATEAYEKARQHFEKVVQLDHGNPDALFGLIVLNLHLARPPEPEWVDQLADELANSPVDATRFSTSQFSFLVRWHLGNNPPLSPGTMARLFDAIDENPSLGRVARAGILAARAAYLDRVLKEPQQALPHAERAVKYWPARWHYRKRYAQLLVRLGHWEKAEETLKNGLNLDIADNQRDEATQMLESVQQRTPLPMDY